MPEIATGIELTIRTAREDEIGWISEFYRREPYLYLDGGHDPDGRPASETYTKAKDAYRNRLRRGEKCFLAFAGPELAHINWLCFTFGEEPVPGKRILLKPHECYTTDAITLDGFRGKNIHAQVLAEMLRAGAAAGCHTAYTVTNIEHRASFKAFEQLGWQILGRLLCFSPRRPGHARLIRLGGSIEPLLRQ